MTGHCGRREGTETYTTVHIRSESSSTARLVIGPMTIHSSNAVIHREYELTMSTFATLLL